MLILNKKTLQKENERPCAKGLKRRLAIMQGDKVLKEFKTNEIKKVKEEVKILKNLGIKEVKIFYIFKNNKEIKHQQQIGSTFFYKKNR